MKRDRLPRETRHFTKIVLTGERAAGKSTALLALLWEAECPAEGFVTRRVLDKTGRRLCFRHVDSAELNGALAAIRDRYTAEERRQAVEAFYCGTKREENPFAWWAATLLTVVSEAGGETNDTPAERRQFTEALRRFCGAARIERAQLLVADEIGGLELADDDLFEDLLNLADCPNHLLLVLKSRAHLERMARHRGLAEAETALLLERRDALEMKLYDRVVRIDWSAIRDEKGKAELIAMAADLLTETFKSL